MRARSADECPALSSEQAVIETVRCGLGSAPSVRVSDWYVRREKYVVAAVETRQPDLRLVVKLEVPGERPNRHLDAMAAIARMVRANTTVPTFDVLAVDVTMRYWPWEYLIVTQVPGLTWHALYPALDEEARAVAQRQIGRAAAELHTLRFGAFGHIGADGAVLDPSPPVDALKHRTRRRIKTPRYQAFMLDVLESRAELLERLSPPTLCHEDLNPHNLVFQLRHGQPVLAGVLDFESAWASTGESDLARLELWWFTTGSAIREGYTETEVLADEYAARRPVLQLLWCLEFAESHSSAEHQALTGTVCSELGVQPISLG